MKKCNKLIAYVLVVLSLFVLFCGSLNVSAELETTTDPYFADATTCTCEEHMNMYATTVPETEPGFSLGEEDMSKVSELGADVKEAGGVFHKFIAKFYELLNKILEAVGKLSGLTEEFGDLTAGLGGLLG